MSYLSHIGEKKCISNNRTTNCTCMMDLVANDEMLVAAGTLMCVQAGRSQAQRDELMIEWERMAVQYSAVFLRKKRKVTNKKCYQGKRKLARSYILSGVYCDDGLQYYVCKNAYQLVFDVGKYIMIRIQKAVKDGKLVPSLHKLCGKQGNATLDAGVMASVISYLEEKHSEAEPHASKQVRTATGMELREDDKQIELPSNYSKRGLYVDWCYNQGFRAKLCGASGYGALKDYVQRDDMVQPAGFDVRKHICTYATFKLIWDKEFKDLVIKKSSHDTCGTCFRFSNLLNGLRRREVAASTSMLREDRLQIGSFNDLGSSGEDSESHVENTSLCVTAPLLLSQRATLQLYNPVNSINNVVCPNDNNQLDNIVDARDTLITDMCKHVNEWKVQRELVLKCKHESVIDKKCGVQWPYRRDTFVGDYCQNFGLPHFGNEQPGETYYYSPLGVYVFGIVNYADEKMNAYVYHEGEGAKGGNNVCSLVWKNLIDLGIIKEWEDSGKKPGRSLTLVFDNCGGQNKNHMVLRLPLWMVEIGLYKKVKIVFLIAGHTKNIADRLFKELKKDCHKSDIFDMVTLVKLMDGSEFVNCFKVSHETFEKWDMMLDKFYKRLETNTTNKNHVFSYCGKDIGAVLTERVTNCLKERQVLIKSRIKNWTPEKYLLRKDEIISFKRNAIPKVGLKDIKAVELYKKFYPLIPFEFKQDFLKMSPPPSLDIMEKVKAERNKKARDKTIKKKQAAASVALLPVTTTAAVSLSHNSHLVCPVKVSSKAKKMDEVIGDEGTI